MIGYDLLVGAHMWQRRARNSSTVRHGGVELSPATHVQFVSYQRVWNQFNTMADHNCPRCDGIHKHFGESRRLLDDGIEYLEFRSGIFGSSLTTSAP